MVLKVQAPRGMTLSRSICSYFEKWGCKKFPKYSKWLTISQAAILLNLPEYKVLRFVSNSKQVHGLLFNDNPLIIHPEGINKRYAKRMRTALTLELRGKGDILKVCNRASKA